MKMIKQNNYKFSYFSTGRFRLGLFGFCISSHPRLFIEATMLKNRIDFYSTREKESVFEINDVKNPLDIKDGSYGILSSIKMPKHLK